MASTIDVLEVTAYSGPDGAPPVATIDIISVSVAQPADAPVTPATVDIISVSVVQPAAAQQQRVWWTFSAVTAWYPCDAFMWWDGAWRAADGNA